MHWRGWKRKLTHRQFSVWQQWQINEWNTPDRHDHYLMALRAEVRSLFSANVKLDDMELEFEEPPKTEEEAKRRAAAKSKGAWSKGMGGQQLVVSKEQMAYLRSLSPDEAVRVKREWASQQASTRNGQE